MTVTSKLYWNRSPYCLDTILAIDPFKPKPATNKAVHPAIPIVVIKNFFLYLKILRATTFWKKFIRLHINGIYSKKIRLPAGGALGLISSAGCSRSSLMVVKITAKTVKQTIAKIATIASFG